jgi:hypothetical protein
VPENCEETVVKFSAQWEQFLFSAERVSRTLPTRTLSEHRRSDQWNGEHTSLGNKGSEHRGAWTHETLQELSSTVSRPRGPLFDVLR